MTSRKTAKYSRFGKRRVNLELDAMSIWDKDGFESSEGEIYLWFDVGFSP